MTALASLPRVVPAARLRGRLTVPGDKSMAHRALIVGALSGGPALVAVRSPGRDLQSTAACLQLLGVTVDETLSHGVSRFTLSGRPTRDAVLDAGNSGTTMRLLAGAVAGLTLNVTLDGDASLRRRPMERLSRLLASTGAEVTTSDGHPPITVRGRERLRAAQHRLPVASAQLLGAAALAGLSADGATTIESPGPTRDHTERILRAAGVRIERTGAVTTVHGPAAPRPMSVTVPGDFSAAAPWIVAAVLHPDAELTLRDVGLNPTRTALIGLLEEMGARVEVRLTDEDGGEPVGEVHVRGGVTLDAVRIGGPRVAALIDELPLVAVLMAAADGVSELRDAAELRVKESDRIAATVVGMATIGADVEELPDGWRVRRGVPADARIATHGDHRIAIAFAIAALAGIATSVELDEPDCVAVSYPGFWDDLAEVAG